jgi:immunity protein, SdpI family
VTTKRSIDARAIAAVAAGYLAGLLAYPLLPGPFLHQQPSARLLVAFTLPTTALVIYVLFRSLWQHDRIRSGNGAFESTYQAIVLRVLLFIVALHALVMIELTPATSAIGFGLAGERIVVVMLGLVMIAIGNLLPRTRPNVAVGLRTTRTLANAQLWQQVHRSSGYITVALGVVIAVAGMVLAHGAVGAVVGGAALVAATSIVVSYRRHAGALPEQDSRG